MKTVLLVEDESDLRFALRRYLERQSYEVLEAESVEQADFQLRAQLPDIALVDHRLPDGDGLEVLRKLRHLAPGVPVLMLTGHGSIELAVTAIKEGAHQFLTKPIKLDVLGLMVERLLDSQRALRASQGSRRKRSHSVVDPFVGRSAAILELRQKAERIAQTRVPLLIDGETGTGKGVLARWLHDSGPRSDESFIELNCAGLSKELLESELFGYEKGAFTGAATSKEGLLEVAHRGTLFLDEIGDMSLEVQPRLLKVIEEQRFRRLGGVRERRVDVRLVAASHHDLAQRAEEGRFRLDLLYRINAIRLTMPRLSERGDDLLDLAGSLLDRLGRELDRPGMTFSTETKAAMLAHSWPGNVRELRNVLERALLFASTSELQPKDLDLATAVRPEGPPSGPLTLKQTIRQAIEGALADQGFHVGKAAEQLDVSRSALYKMVQRHDIPLRGNEALKRP